jgi:hypothetical protein
LSKKKGPPTLKGLLKKGNQRFGTSSSSSFDVMEEREKMLQDHRSRDTDLGPASPNGGVRESSLHDPTLSIKTSGELNSDGGLNASVALPLSVSPSPIVDMDSLSKKAPEPVLEGSLVRKQYVNNADAADYVNESVYVNKSALMRKQDDPENEPRKPTTRQMRKQTVNSAETFVYVNNSDYVNKAETNSRPDDLNQKLSEYFGESKHDESVNKSVYVNNTDTERKQSVNTGNVVRKQSGNKINEYVNNASTGSQTNADTERKQESIFRLARTENLIFGFIMRLCITNGSTKTPPISYVQIAEAASTTANSAKTLVARLIKKGFLNRAGFSTGPGSRTSFVVPNDAYQAYLMMSHSMMNFEMRNQSGNNAETGSQTSARTTRSSSSSNILINNTTTEEPLKEEPWLQIRIPPFLERQGFTMTHAKQILGDKANPFSVEEVQECFDNFAIDLENGILSIKSTPIQFFLGIVRKGRARYESKFASEQLAKDISNHIQTTKALIELQKEQAKLQLAEKCSEALSKMSQDEKNALVEPNKFMEPGSLIHDQMVRAELLKRSGIDI